MKRSIKKQNCDSSTKKGDKTMFEKQSFKATKFKKNIRKTSLSSADVTMSKSFGVLFIMRSLTQPPTRYTSYPAQSQT